jgi:hypothetical protein
VQLTIKESLKELPPMVVEEETMLKKALEMSQKGPENSIEEITTLAY